MKFLALKTAIQEAGLDAAQPPPPYVPPQSVSNKPERVEHGDVNWKPVDKQAAMVIAKAPWWAHPPIDSNTKTQPYNAMNKVQLKAEIEAAEKTISKSLHCLVDIGKSVTTLTQAIQLLDESFLSEQIVKSNEEYSLMIARLQAQHSEARLLWAKENTEFVRELAEHAQAVVTQRIRFNSALTTSREEGDKYLTELRQTRYAIVSEIAAIIAPLRDIRQFFLAENYEQEITRLREYVELCERLQSLKKSGFLDAVADTMLNLAAGSK